MLDISDQLLVRLAGAEVFEQGKALLRAQPAPDWQHNRQRITAHISDPADQREYQTQLTHTRSTLDAKCDCEVSGGFDFCAHSVALALVWRDWLQQKHEAERGSDAQRITTYIQSLTSEQLASALLEIIDNDNSLTQQWILKADRALGTLDLQQLRKRINQLLPAQLRSPAALKKAVDRIASLLQDVNDEIPAGDSAELCHHALQRISSHEQAAVLSECAADAIARINRCLTAGFIASGWSESVKTAFLLELLAAADPDFYPRIPEDFLAAFTPEAENALFTAITDSWRRQLEADTDDIANNVVANRMRRALVNYAGDAGDRQSVINIYAAHATTVPDFLELTELCLKLDQTESAAHWLELAKDNNRDGQHRRDITRLTVGLNLALDNVGAARDAQWILFRTSLLAVDLQPLPGITGEALAVWHERGETEIEKQIDAATKQRGQAILYERLTQFYLDTNKAEDAAAIASEHAVSAELLEAILQRLSDMNIARPLYFRLARLLVETGESTAYRRAVDLLSELNAKLHTRGQQQAFSEALQQLRQQLSSKRNFSKWLNEAFPVSPVNGA